MAGESERIKAIFLAAIEKTESTERASYLEEACAGDAALRARVAALLEAHERADQLLDRAAFEHFAADEDEGIAVESPEPTADDGERLEFLAPSQKAGSLGLLAHYEVLEVIGRGGMGVVLRAFDEKLHRIVAIKTLSPLLAATGDVEQRFLREARAAAAVTHENIIAIHAVEDAGVRPYLVMQYISGKSLQEKLDHSGSLPTIEILRIGRQIAEGLAAAHRQGLIHRDIKPANILLENGIERVKITDFGLARSVDDERLTQIGIVSGTPLYMSPEQASGEPVDHRADLFSLGSVLYAVCTGHSPFRASSSMAVLKRVCEDAHRPMREINPDVPPWLETIVGRLLAKNPADRFQTAAEVATILSRCLAQLQTGVNIGDIAVPAEPQSAPPRRAEEPHRPFRFARPALAGVVLIGLALAFWLIPKTWFAEPRGAQADKDAKQSAPMPQQPLVLKPSRTLEGHNGGVVSVAFSPNGKWLASGGTDRSIRLWDTQTWQPREPLKGHRGRVIALAFSPDNRVLASVTDTNDECMIRLWDVDNNRQAKTLGWQWYGVFGLTYSPDGKTMACGGYDKSVHFWDVATETDREFQHDIAPNHVRGLSFSPDGKLLATGGSGETRLWDTETGKEIPSNFPADMCPMFVPGSNELAGWIFTEGRVTICAIPSGKVRKTWRAHPQLIEGLAVSPDGRFLASVGSEGIAHVWATADGSKVANLVGHEGSVYATAFMPDGTQLATTGKDDFTVRLWDLPAICRVSRRAAE